MYFVWLSRISMYFVLFIYVGYRCILFVYICGISMYFVCLHLWDIDVFCLFTFM